jgi:hypothetical protein
MMQERGLKRHGAGGVDVVSFRRSMMRGILFFALSL